MKMSDKTTETKERLKTDADWLDSYSHDLMETGELDQEAARLAAIAKRIRVALTSLQS
jgi:hypothetical protein